MKTRISQNLRFLLAACFTTILLLASAQVCLAQVEGEFIRPRQEGALQGQNWPHQDHQGQGAGADAWP